METYYAHLSKTIAHVGDTIPEGTVVGLGGRTGRATTDHLHFEFRLNHKPYNPELLFDFNNLEVISNSVALTQKKPAKEKHVATNDSPRSKEFHVIVKKDTLFTLARKYHTSVKTLCALNGIQPNSTLKIGKRLKVN